MLYMHDKKVILDVPDQNNISVRTETKRYLACLLYHNNQPILLTTLHSILRNYGTKNKITNKWKQLI